MTPAPAPPPAGSPLGSTLTAEQIAAIRAHYNKMTSGLASWELYDIPTLIASHAALAHRLARAEARIVVLEGVLRSIEHVDIGGWTEWGGALPICPACRVQYEEPHELDCPLATALATPTAPYDGATRAGDAAEGEAGE